MLPFLRAEIETFNKHFGHKSGQKHPMLLQKACREWLSNDESLAAILVSENHIFFHRPILIPPRFWGGGGGCKHMRQHGGCTRHCRGGEGERKKSEI